MQLELVEKDQKSYINKDLAQYYLELDEAQIRQLRKLSDNMQSFQINSINVNFSNSFNENWTFDITYAPCDIKTETDAHVQIDFYPYTIPLQNSTLNELIDHLHYPLQHKNFSTTLNLVDSHGNPAQFITDGELDFVTNKMLYWSVENGKLVYHSNWTTQLSYYPGPKVIYNYRYVNDIQQTVTGTTEFYMNELSHIVQQTLFTISNFYYANQLMGFTNQITSIQPGQTLQDNEDFIVQLSSTFTPTTLDNVNYYYELRKLTANIIMLPNTQIIGDLYNRSITLPKCYFLQLWRELYVQTDLQTRNIIQNTQNVQLITQYPLTYSLKNRFQQNYLVDKDQIYKENIYQFNKYEQVVCYYINSLSFNSYCSIQNNYPLQYNGIDQKYNIEMLKKIKFYITDEHNVLIPRLNEFKVYIQITPTQIEERQLKTNNINRVIAE